MPNLVNEANDRAMCNHMKWQGVDCNLDSSDQGWGSIGTLIAIICESINDVTLSLLNILVARAFANEEKTAIKSSFVDKCHSVELSYLHRNLPSRHAPPKFSRRCQM